MLGFIGCRHVLAVVLVFALAAGAVTAASPSSPSSSSSSSYPIKYDASQLSSSLWLSNATFSIQQSPPGGVDELLPAADRWIVKIKEGELGNCTEITARICLEDEDTTCIWSDKSDSHCLFTLETGSIDSLLVRYSMYIEFAERDMKVVMEQEQGGGSSRCTYPFPQSAAPWHLDRIDSPSVQSPFDDMFQSPESITGENVHIYVLDTGLRWSHMEFEGRVGNGVNVMAGASGGVEGGDPSNYWDDHGHGTAVASVAAGSVYGICKCCTVHGVKCLDENGDGSYTEVVAGLYWVLRNAVRPAVASLSLSGPTSEAINQAIYELYQNGILTIAAAGNEAVDACTRSPGSSPYAVTVGSSDRNNRNEDIRSGFSNYGACVNVYAPGSSVQTAHFGGDQSATVKSGTSFSAPAVAGVASLYLSSYPDSSTAIQHQKVTGASVSAPTIEADARLLNVRLLDVCSSDEEPVSCVLSEWSEWSPPCPSPEEMCGRPTQRRSRSILSEPSCGADVCPRTQDMRYCQGEYTPCPSNFPTQWFGTNDQLNRAAPDLDIQGRTIRYDPKKSSAFSACIDDHVGYEPLEDFSQAVKLEMGDDSFVEVTLGESGFPFLDSVTNSIFIGSNGYVTFDEGDFSYMVGELRENQEPRVLLQSSGAAGNASSIIKHSFAHINEDVKRMMMMSSINVEGHDDFISSTAPHWIRKRVAGLFQDMNPSASGDHGVYFESKGAGTAQSRLVVTYDRVPIWGMDEETNTFQIVLYLPGSLQEGRIKLWWGQISGVYRPLVGISPGRFDPDQIESNLIPDLGTCSGGELPIVPPPPTIQAFAEPAAPAPAPIAFPFLTFSF